jgi:hypothetical protein
VKKSLAGILFVFWTTIVIIVFYIVQRPNISALVGLADTVWTLLVAAVLLFNAYGTGTFCLDWAGWDPQDTSTRFLLGTGIGLGCLGILGLVVSALQLAHLPALMFMQFALALFLVFKNSHSKLRKDIAALTQDLNRYWSQIHLPVKIAVLLPLVFSFLLTLTPPFEAFDALFYHLTLPARILQDGGLQVIDIPHFWFPNITEHVYLWALAFHSERAAQVIHFAWGMMSVLLLWHWASRVWNIEIGRKTVLLLITIPSLPMLASWAYADMALCFYSIAALFTLTQYKSTQSAHWLRITGIFCGLAMGIKYTSFVLPLTCGILLLFHRPLKNAIRAAAQFSGIAILVAIPWYLRNAILMGNPFYPFAFGGKYWDSFLANWYSGAGTGIGWNLLQIIRLPLDATLGYHDANYFDGRIGPIFLILIPITLWILFTHPRRDLTQTWSLLSISIFTTLSLAAWTIGVINSSALWQTRLLFPALIPFIIPSALGWHALATEFDTSKMRVGFLINSLIAIVIILTIFDNGMFVLQRNPLAVALGAQSRERYIERTNPPYAALIQLMDELPTNAKVYSLFEPRTYGLPRSTYPDAILANFAHELYLYNSTDEIIQHWQEHGYTHILVYNDGLKFMLENNQEYMKPDLHNALAETLGKLQMLDRTTDGGYSIYKIPQ